MHGLCINWVRREKGEGEEDWVMGGEGGGFVRRRGERKGRGDCVRRRGRSVVEGGPPCGSLDSQFTPER